MKTFFSRKKQSPRTAGLVVLALSASLILSQAMAADNPPEELWVPPKTFQPMATISAQKPSPNLRSNLLSRKNQKRVELYSLSNEQLKLKSAQTDRGRTKAGFTRNIPDFQTTQQTQTGLVWEVAPDGGQVSLLSFSSPSALALR